MTFAEQIGRNLRKARRRAYMSQCELSRGAGLHHATISLLELGLRVPRIDTCAKIVESTEVDSHASRLRRRLDPWRRRFVFDALGGRLPAPGRSGR